MSDTEPSPADRSNVRSADSPQAARTTAQTDSADQTDSAGQAGTADPAGTAHPAGRADQTGRADQAPGAVAIGVGRTHDYTSAVYGSVLAATVVVSASDLRAPGVLAALLLTSGVVFWVAHVYAATVAGVHGGWHLGAIWTGLRHEWPVAFAAVPPAIAALLTLMVPPLSFHDGVWLALIVAIAEQQLWGYAAVRGAKLTGSALVTTMLLNIFMGFVIVGLKLTLNH